MDTPISAKAAILQELTRSGSGSGADLLRRIEKRTHDLLTLKEGSLYPALTALEKSGLIRKLPDQHKYAATESGRQLAQKHSTTIELLYGTGNKHLTIDSIRSALSPRQAEVAALLLTPRHVKDIAVELGMTYGTLRKHSENLYKRLGVHSRAELIATVNRNQRRTQVPTKYDQRRTQVLTKYVRPRSNDSK